MLRFFDDAALGQAVSSTFNVLTCQLTRHWLLPRNDCRSTTSWSAIATSGRRMGYIDFHEAPGTTFTVDATA